MYWRTSSLILPVLALLNVAVAADEPQAPKPDTIAIIRLDRPITDKPMSDDPLFGTAAPEALRDLVQRFKKAADDPKVAAVVVLWGENGLGRGLAEELLQAFDKVKASKPIYAHADSLTTGGYTVLSNASRLSVSPTGDVWVTGIYGEQLYLRGLLDLLKVQPDFLTCGEYKSAAETFMRSGPSEMYGLGDVRLAVRWHLRRDDGPHGPRARCRCDESPRMDQARTVLLRSGSAKGTH